MRLAYATLEASDPLQIPSRFDTADVDGKAIYRMRAINGQLMSKTFEQTNTINDVFRIMVGLRYNFN